MSILHYNDKKLSEVKKTTFGNEGMLERQDIQTALKKDISVISDDLLIISEEFSEWSNSQKRIDLLAVDKQANIVVIELKRSETGEYMELQAIRYAAMISTLTWQNTIDIFSKYLKKEYPDDTKDAEQELLDFFDDDFFDDKTHEEKDKVLADKFGQETHIMLISANFSDELITSVIWLNNTGLNIKCVRIIPHNFKDEILIDAQQIIPLPEAEKYQIRARKKDEEQKAARHSKRDFTRHQFNGEIYNKRRLVLAVIKRWIDQENPQNIDDLERAFPQNTDPELGHVYARLNEVPEARQGRYFTKEEEQINFPDGSCYVIYNQWGGPRHKHFIEISRKLGFTIEEAD